MAFQALLAAVPVATSLLNQPNAQDAARFAEAQQKYQAAIQGDSTALCFLKYMSGRYGGGTCADGYHSGYATQAAKANAGKLYDQALAILGGQMSASTPLPATPIAFGTSQTGTALITAGSAVAQAGATLAGQTAAPLTPQQQLVQSQQRQQQLLMWLAVVALGVGAYMLLRRR